MIGQYLGIGSLIAISALGSLLALVVPSYIIGLMGLVPIAIGIKEFYEMRSSKDRINEEEEEEEISRNKKLLQQQEKKIGIRHHPIFHSLQSQL